MALRPIEELFVDLPVYIEHTPAPIDIIEVRDGPIEPLIKMQTRGIRKSNRNKRAKKVRLVPCDYHRQRHQRCWKECPYRD